MDSEKNVEFSQNELRYARTLSDILHLHRWAGGDQVSLSTIFGLAHGIESVIRESLPKGISEETQRKIEDVLADVDCGKQSSDSLALKARFYREGVSDSDARIIMKLCILQSRFTDVIKEISEGKGATFSNLLSEKTETSNWDGAKIYMELILDTNLGKGRPEMIATFAPCLPRVGESMDLSDLFTGYSVLQAEVVGIEYRAYRMEDPLDKHPMAKLIPYVILNPLVMLALQEETQ